MYKTDSKNAEAFRQQPEWSTRNTGHVNPK